MTDGHPVNTMPVRFVDTLVVVICRCSPFARPETSCVEPASRHVIRDCQNQVSILLRLHELDGTRHILFLEPRRYIYRTYAVEATTTSRITALPYLGPVSSRQKHENRRMKMMRNSPHVATYSRPLPKYHPNAPPSSQKIRVIEK